MRNVILSSFDPKNIPKEFLNTIAQPLHRIQPGSTSSKPAGYSPQQIRRAYGIDKLINAGITGKEQNIAIITTGKNATLEADLQVFSNTFGLPPAKLNIHFFQGVPEDNPSFDLETALDVQWAHALAPDATIHVVVAKNNLLFNIFLAAVDFANSLGVQVVSMSFVSLGGEFPDELFGDQFVQHPGTVYLAGSGDTGGQTFYPSASPFVVSVGGTTLPLDKKGKRIGPETGWEVQASSNQNQTTRFNSVFNPADAEPLQMCPLSQTLPQVSPFSLVP